jgi:hypothetical protein
LANAPGNSCYNWFLGLCCTGKAKAIGSNPLAGFLVQIGCGSEEEERDSGHRSGGRASNTWIKPDDTTMGPFARALIMLG